jgi:DNA-binding MarR family transcriptional regulator
MNQTAEARRLAGARPASPAVLPPPPAADEVRRQAREMDNVFKALARKVLIDDDPASELPLRQFRVCAALFGGACSMKELSLRLGVSQSAITQLADRLEAAGMVTRGPIGDDRRVRNLELTDRARKLMRIREERRIERVMQILARMSTDGREAVMSSMAALKDAVQSDEC